MKMNDEEEDRDNNIDGSVGVSLSSTYMRYVYYLLNEKQIRF